jgi:hypothetical protein
MKGDDETFREALLMIVVSPPTGRIKDNHAS